TDYAGPLLAREKLGATAIGKGVALPHARAEFLSSPVAAAAVLSEPICIPAPNGLEVDVVIALISPDGPPADIRRISAIVKELRQEQVINVFRTARTGSELVSALKAIAGS